MAIELLTVARVLAGASGVALLVAAAWTRSAWRAPSARSFSVLIGLLGTSALALAAVAPNRPAYSVVWLLTLLAIPVAFGAFALDYYGLDLVTTPWRLAAFALPAVAAGGSGVAYHLLRPPSMGTGMGGGTGMMGPAPPGLSPLALDLLVAVREVGLYYASGVILVAVALVVGTVVQYDHLGPGVVVTLSFLGVWQWGGYLLMPEVMAATDYATALALIGGCYAVSVVAVGTVAGVGGLFETLPAAGTVGSRTALDSLDDPMLTVDDSGTVLCANEAACRTFDPSRAVGSPLERVVGVDVGTLRERDRLSLETTEGSRWFQPGLSAVAGRGDIRLGTVIVLRDVTRRRTREQRLQVLNRVLRHNLRNDMNVIRGNAELIADGAGIDPSTGAEQIRRTADELVELGERAREVERMMSFEEYPEPAVDVVATVETAVSAVGERYPAVEVTTAVPADSTLPVDGRVLRVVLENVIENACQHNDADEPIVVVSADRSEDRFRLAVSDNGPGIPEMERSVIDAGTEDPLEHSTGLGLWAVEWGVTRLGGELSFADNEPRGAVVRIDLPTGEP